MPVSGPQRNLFFACLAVGAGCLVLLDFVFVPAALSSEPDEARDAAADVATPEPVAAPAASVKPEASVQVVIPAAARVPTIVARFDSEAKEPSDQSGIRALARALIEDHQAQVVLEGHSDTYGGEDYNHEISLARAEWVKGRLVELGISPDRIQTAGLGATRPLHSDVDAQASVNRRVEVKWLSQ